MEHTGEEEEKRQVGDRLQVQVSKLQGGRCGTVPINQLPISVPIVYPIALTVLDTTTALAQSVGCTASNT